MTLGRVWKFGDGVDTDVMYPGKALRLTSADACDLLFEGVRPGWSSQVVEGDIVVGGHNFGIGSARPVGVLLFMVGIRAVLAESMSSLFQRNCINAGLFAAAAPGITAMCEEGDQLGVDMDRGLATLAATGKTCPVPVLPPFVRRIVDDGGVLNQLRNDGFLGPG
jgi:3-isopropylmalate/(R)-2-methylmalate dehydratase small subunit